MGAGRLVAAAAIIGGGYWAYSQGYLAPVLAKLGLGGNSPGAGGAPRDPDDDDANFFGPWLPVGGTPDPAPNQWEKVLRDNWSHVQPWARANVEWVAAIIRQESGTQGSKARGGAGEIGLMQVKPATAVWMKNIGFGAMAATEAVLATDAGGVYFGTAFLQYLSGIKNDRAWITKAYNGGPGWEAMGENYMAARETYHAGVLAKFNSMYSQEV